MNKDLKTKRKIQLSEQSPYTEKQLQIINGEIPLESVDGHTLRWFYKKAIENKDDDWAARIKIRIDILKEASRDRNRKRASIRVKKIMQNEPIKWKQPKSNEYTEHQKKVIRNEIPLSEVHTNELVSIHQKAHNVGDFELSERILDLINERREASISKQEQRKKLTNKHSSAYDRTSILTISEQALINGDTHWDDYTEEDIKNIIAKLEKENRESDLNIAKEILHYKQHPKIGYVVTTHEDSIALLEELLKTTIRRPNTWFIKETD